MISPTIFFSIRFGIIILMITFLLFTYNTALWLLLRWSLFGWLILRWLLLGGELVRWLHLLIYVDYQTQATSFQMTFSCNLYRLPKINTLYKWQVLTLNITKTMLRRNWIPEQLPRLLFRVSSTPPWLFRRVKVSTSLQLCPDYFRLSNFFDCSDIQFFDLPLSQHRQLDYLYLYLSLCSTIVTYRSLCHASGHLMLST